MDNGLGISGPISETERGSATERLQELLGIAEASGDNDSTDVYVRRALGHGLRFDENTTSTAYVLDVSEAHELFGLITIGKSFFSKGISTELIQNFPDDAKLLASQTLRVQQLYRLRHEIAHMSYTNRQLISYGEREDDPVEIDAAGQAMDWIRRNVINAH